jgi:large subunit ribosomal protein L13
MKTYRTKPSDIEQAWYVVDAAALPLGRLASNVASILRGKHKPYYTTHLDTGDHVIVVNARQMVVTGNKLENKVYTRYTGHPGGLKTTTLKERMAKDPTGVIRSAVKGMLPRGPLGRKMLTKLHVYAEADHPHQAQQPEPLELKQ